MTSAETDKTAGCNLLLYRMYIVLKTSVANGRLRRWPAAKKGLEQFKGLIRRRFLRKTQAWVQIQSGLSQGMWMQIAIPGEGFLWRGEHEPDVQMAISAALRPGVVFYDVGAHVGIMNLALPGWLAPLAEWLPSMAIPKIFNACARIRRRTGILKIGFKLCTLPYGLVQWPVEFRFAAAPASGLREGLKPMELVQCWRRVKS